MIDAATSPRWEPRSLDPGKNRGRRDDLAATRETALLRNCRLEIGYGSTRLLPPIDLELESGQFWAIIGRNGCGKTTWLRTLLGLLPPLGGTLERRPGLRLAYLRQRSEVDDLYPLLARDVVSMGTLRDGVWFGPARRRAVEVDRALALMGATDLGSEPFCTLSEGQRQRILFARVAASRPHLALLDEPTSAMDLVAEREAFGWLQHLREETGVTVVVVSHYVELVVDFADHAVLFDRDTPAVVAGRPQRVLQDPAFATQYGASVEAGQP